MTEFVEVLGYDFMQRALIAGALAAVVCAVIGTLVVVNRLVFLAGGVAHTAYGGLGIAVLAGFAPLLGAAGFAVLMALLMAWATRDRKTRTDAVTGVMWAFGMALGVILMDLDRSGGYQADLMSYLFGGLLTVAKSDLIAMGTYAVVLLIATGFMYQRFLAIAYDDEFAQARGLRTGAIFAFLLVLTAVAVVLLIRVVGLLLVIALLSIGPYLAERRCSSMRQMMLVSGVLNLVFIAVGIVLSYRFDLSSGPSIIVVACFVFTVDEIIGRLRPT
jgi:zinc transport system permease protein